MAHRAEPLRDRVRPDLEVKQSCQASVPSVYFDPSCPEQPQHSGLAVERTAEKAAIAGITPI